MFNGKSVRQIAPVVDKLEGRAELIQVNERPNWPPFKKLENEKTGVVTERNLTRTHSPVTMTKAGKTEAGSAELQPADSLLKATNSDPDGGPIFAILFRNPKTILELS